jgi:hypothetical protein
LRYFIISWYHGIADNRLNPRETMMSDKSCADCPSFVPPEGTADLLNGRKVDVPWCRRYGKPLGLPGRDNTPIFVREANVCRSYKRPLATKVVDAPNPVIFAGDDAVREAAAARVADGNVEPAFTSCMMCSNCVTQEAVNDRVGIPLPACRFHGKLIISPLKEVQTCQYRSKGAPQTDCDLELLPQFAEVMNAPVKLRRSKASDKASGLRPDNLCSLPVPEHEQDKIEGFIEVNKDKGLYLPVFKPTFFDQSEIDLIPVEGDDGHPELYVDHLGILEMWMFVSYTCDETLVLVGEAGTGKTEFARWLAWLMQMPFMDISYRSTTATEEILGMMEVRPGQDHGMETYFKPGTLPTRWAKPGIVLSDEWNLAPEEIQAVYRSMNTSARTIQVLDHRIKRHDYCFHLTAMNPSWDYRNIGARELADPDTSRLAFMEVTVPPDDVASDIIVRRCEELDGFTPDASTVRAILKTSRDIRELAYNNQFPYSWGMRQMIKVARFSRGVPIMAAYHLAYLAYASPEIRDLVKPLIKSNHKDA